jgi:hypothetical protein
MGYTLLAASFVVALFSAMLLLLEVGRRIGARQMVVDPEAVNEWIANSTNRVVAANTHPPFAICAVLVGLALVSSLIAGYAMAEAKVRSWLHIVVFAAVITVTIYVIIDLELPRIGFIRLTATDRLLVELRRKMG